MSTALRLTTRVLAGSRMEITARELREGNAVDVFVVLPDKPAPASPSLLDALPPGLKRNTPSVPSANNERCLPPRRQKEKKQRLRPVWTPPS